jgi:hypothetical protein
MTFFYLGTFKFQFYHVEKLTDVVKLSEILIMLLFIIDQNIPGDLET